MFKLAAQIGPHLAREEDLLGAPGASRPCARPARLPAPAPKKAKKDKAAALQQLEAGPSGEAAAAPTRKAARPAEPQPRAAAEAAPQPPPAKKARRARAPDQPKRATSAYGFYLKASHAGAQADAAKAAPGDGGGFGAASKLLGARWKALSAAERAPYEALAAADRQRSAAALEGRAPPRAAGGKAAAAAGAARKPRGAGGFSKPRQLSAEMEALLQIGPLASQTEVVKALWRYITAKALADPAERRYILADEALQALFGVERFSGLSACARGGGGGGGGADAHARSDHEAHPAAPAQGERGGGGGVCGGEGGRGGGEGRCGGGGGGGGG